MSRNKFRKNFGTLATLSRHSLSGFCQKFAFFQVRNLNGFFLLEMKQTKWRSKKTSFSDVIRAVSMNGRKKIFKFDIFHDSFHSQIVLK